MNAAHLHLMVNHLPIIGTVGVVLLLLLAYVRRSEELTRVAMGLTFVLALVAVGVMLTGEPAEELIDGYAGVNERAVESHEEAARLATIGLGVTGVVSAALLLLARGRAIGAGTRAVMLTLTLACSALFARAATLGGEIRHPEISGAQPAMGTEEEIHH